MATMEFENLKKSRQAATFTLTPTHVSYANTLRRLIMTAVETVGFRADMTTMGTTSDVTIKANTTPMTNEMLAHRIGLLPLAVKEPLKWQPDNFVFSLVVTGDKDRPKDIFASDIKVTEKVPNELEPVEVPTERFFPPNPITGETCLIATLYPGETQKLEFVARATVGTGRENARWQPTQQCTYEYTHDPDPVKKKELFEKWLVSAKKVSPAGMDETSEKYLALEREFNTMEVARCFLKDDNGEPYSFDFVVESVGPLDPVYIVQRACEVGQAMVAKYVTLDSGDVPEEMRISPSKSRVIGYDFLIRGHDHTLGNLIQTYLSENHMNSQGGPDKPTKITYAGYNVPHPLRDEVLIRIGVEDGKEYTARKAFAEACRGCEEVFRKMRSAWMTANGMAEEKKEEAKAKAKSGVVTFRRKTPSAKPAPAK
jgi:DNA-directed RNA polymerase subunit D